LKIGTKGGGIFNGQPIAYQTVDGRRRNVAARWVVRDSRTATFKLGAYDASRPLVIDPLVFGTYYGGEDGTDEIRAAIGDEGKVVIVGSTDSPDFPAIYGPYGDSFNPDSRDTFVARLSSDGSSQDYSALIGGNGDDVAQFVKFDGEGNLWVAGTTSSTNFPQSFATAGNQGANSVFVTRFARFAQTVFNPITPTLSSAVFAMNNPGGALSGFDVRPGATGTIRFAFTGVTSVALPTGIVANNGSATVAGRAAGHFFEGHRTGYIVRFSYDSETNAFTTDTTASQYVQGIRRNEVRGVVLDTDDNAYIVGTVYRADPLSNDTSPLNIDTSVNSGGQPNSRFFETTARFLRPNNNSTDPYVTGRVLKATDVFIRKYTPAGSFRNNGTPSASQGFSGVIGGNGDDEAGGMATSVDIKATSTSGPSSTPSTIYTGSAIALGPSNSIYITGTMLSSNNFPTTSGAFQPRLTDAANVFVTRINALATNIDASTGLAVTSEPIGTDPSYNPNFSPPYVLERTSAFAPWEPTTVVPAGIAVDVRGYAFITGNLRARRVIFPSPTPGDPNQPTGSVLSSIYFPATKEAIDALNPADRTYESPTGAEYPTTEGFLSVLPPTLSSLLLQSYLGGINDELVFAPAIDPPSGDVYANGWTDGLRYYIRVSSTGTVTEQIPGGRDGFLPNGFPNPPGDSLLTSPRIKTNENFRGSGIYNRYGYGFWGTQGVASPTYIQVLRGSDGFITRIKAGQPGPSRLASLVLDPATVESGGTSVGTITLTNTAPEGGLRVFISADDAAKVTFSGSAVGTDPELGTYVTVPAGATTATFTIKAVTVQADATVVLTARTAQVADQIQATLVIKALSFTLTLNPSSVVGDQTVVTGTITLINPATEDLVFTQTSSDTTLVPIDSTNATVTIPTGSTTGTFTLRPKTALTSKVVTITSTSNGLSKTASLQLRAPALINLVPSQTTIRSSTGYLDLSLYFDFPTASGGTVTLTISPNSVFAGARTFTVPAGTSIYQIHLVPNRLSRSQNVTIRATYNGSTQATTVTVTR